jgi:hypothetical protein
MHYFYFAQSIRLHSSKYISGCGVRTFMAMPLSCLVSTRSSKATGTSLMLAIQVVQYMPAGVNMRVA